MFRTEPLVKIQLLMLASEAPDAALELARFGVFNPGKMGGQFDLETQAKVELFPDSPARRYREIWLEAEKRLDKLLMQCGDLQPLQIAADAAAPTLADLEALNGWLKEVLVACLACHEGEERIQEERKHLDALEETLAKLEGLNVDLAELLRQDSLLSVHIGSVQASAVKRMTEALSMNDTLMSPFDRVGDWVFAVIAGPRLDQAEVQGVLAQAGWRELPVPAELRTLPQQARVWLAQERQRLGEVSGAECKVMQVLRDEFRPHLHDARVRLALARPLAEAAQVGVHGRGGLAALAGWVPSRQVAELQALLAARFHGRCWLEVRQPDAREATQVPSLVHYPGWLKPFVPLVKSYGVPRYGEFDPALPFALLYLLLFGAMFGDIGHGAVILLLSIFLLKKIGRLAWVGAAAGAVSMLFGVLYGSIFGYEDVLEPVWLSPMHHPEHVLTVAVALGVGFIILTLLASARNKWVSGQTAAALFDATGFAGLLFYLGAVGGLAVEGDLLHADVIGVDLWIFAILGMVMVAAYKGFEAQGGLGERILVTLIEVLETAINLFSNTLSFMRVAAFSLNHVALALAVFALAAGLSAAAHGITVVLGNAVIIVLEGGIVAIQALRLMYFEGFSRFFNGDGRLFAPLHLGLATEVGYGEDAGRDAGKDSGKGS